MRGRQSHIGAHDALRWRLTYSTDSFSISKLEVLYEKKRSRFRTSNPGLVACEEKIGTVRLYDL